MEAVKVAYEKAKLTGEQKFVFLSKTFPADVMISDFVTLYSPQTFEDLINILKAYKQSKARFSGGTSYTTTESAQDIRMPSLRVIRRNEEAAQGKEMKQAVEDTCQCLAELSLIM